MIEKPTENPPSSLDRLKNATAQLNNAVDLSSIEREAMHLKDALLEAAKETSSVAREALRAQIDAASKALDRFSSENKAVIEAKNAIASIRSELADLSAKIIPSKEQTIFGKVLSYFGLDSLFSKDEKKEFPFAEKLPKWGLTFLTLVPGINMIPGVKENLLERIAHMDAVGIAKELVEDENKRRASDAKIKIDLANTTLFRSLISQKDRGNIGKFVYDAIQSHSEQFVLTWGEISKFQKGKEEVKKAEEAVVAKEAPVKEASPEQTA